MFRPPLVSMALVPMALAPLVLVAAPLAAQATGDLATVQRYLQGITSMTADFSQTDRNGKVLTGQLTIKTPGKLRFQYEKGVPLLVVADGQSLWFLDYSVGQKSRYPLNQTPLSFLLNNRIDKSFQMKTLDGYPLDVIALDARNTKHPEYGNLLVKFRKITGSSDKVEILGWVAYDPQGNKTSVYLKNIRYNVAVPENYFAWRNPSSSKGARK